MAVKHQAKLPKLNRDSKHRTALYRIQLCELIENGSLTTTVTKAKIIKRHFDKLTTKAMGGTLSSRRLVIAELGRPKIANRLVDSIVPTLGDRKSGFTSMRKVAIRRGDSTAMAILKILVTTPAVEEGKKVEEKVKKAK